MISAFFHFHEQKPPQIVERKLVIKDKNRELVSTVGFFYIQTFVEHLKNECSHVEHPRIMKSTVLVFCHSTIHYTQSNLKFFPLLNQNYTD